MCNITSRTSTRTKSCLEPLCLLPWQRRAQGKPGKPEYFGCGVIGAVWRDEEIPKSEPKGKWTWFCEIVDYLPFIRPVPAKQGDESIEKISKQYFWRDAVRKLPPDAYDRILALTGLVGAAPVIVPSSAIMPKINEVSIPSALEGRSLLMPQTRMTTGEGRSAERYSRNAKQVGDRAEEIVLRYLSDQLSQIGATELRWVAGKERRQVGTSNTLTPMANLRRLR